MNKRRYHELMVRLERAGFSFDEANKLRRIEMTLQRWHEHECGTGEGQVTRSIERDEDGDGKPYMRVQYPTATGYVDRRWPIADRERGAHKRLAKIMAAHPDFVPYVQGDPRGCALYLVPKAYLTDGRDVNAYYTQGLAVCE